MKQTITLYHLDGEPSTMDIVVPEDNPIEGVEISMVWEDSDEEISFEAEFDRTLN